MINLLNLQRRDLVQRIKPITTLLFLLKPVHM